MSDYIHIESINGVLETNSGQETPIDITNTTKDNFVCYISVECDNFDGTFF
jgi:hypothetical protein